MGSRPIYISAGTPCPIQSNTIGRKSKASNRDILHSSSYRNHGEREVKNKVDVTALSKVDKAEGSIAVFLISHSQ